VLPVAEGKLSPFTQMVILDAARPRRNGRLLEGSPVSLDANESLSAGFSSLKPVSLSLPFSAVPIVEPFVLYNAVR